MECSFLNSSIFIDVWLFRIYLILTSLSSDTFFCSRTE
uniref:Uncharacterized protein n=1 Tax=Brugia malayi TaxID=6279 RepID=A8QCD2_BRUMA